MNLADVGYDSPKAHVNLADVGYDSPKARANLADVEYDSPKAHVNLTDVGYDSPKAHVNLVDVGYPVETLWFPAPRNFQIIYLFNLLASSVPDERYSSKCLVY